MINNIVKLSGYIFMLARVNSGESRVLNGGVRAARIIRLSQDEPCVPTIIFAPSPNPHAPRRPVRSAILYVRVKFNEDKHDRLISSSALCVV